MLSMKKILLLAVAALMVTTANAQTKRSETAVTAPARPQMQVVKPQVLTKEAQKRLPGTPVIKAPKKAANIDISYRRPAGAFPASIVVEDGAYSGVLYAPYIAMTPYVDYTFTGMADGQDPASTYEWDVNFWDMSDETAEEAIWETVPGMGESGMDLTWQWGYETADVPIFYVYEPDNFHTFQLKGYDMGGTDAAPIIEAEYTQTILSVPSTMEIWDRDYLKSSKNFCWGGRYGTESAPFITYTGAEPNGAGYWFGTNGFHNVAQPRYFVDGVAQAFEKPTSPYLLKNVSVMTSALEVTAPVEMQCRIYKLDEIPAYVNDTTSAILPEEPGELIAMGKATVTPETEATTGGLVVFTLYGEEDGLQYDITPTIDCAILVVIDGYNDPGMENLKEFSAMICTDDQVDEGFGELAYLKFAWADDEGQPDSYRWEGLNGFFSGGGMKTGFSVFLSTENPYLTYNYNAEDGEYLFPNEGGLMEKHFGDYTTRSIEFWSWVPSADDGWYVFLNNGDEVPDWLSIELTDIASSTGAFSGLVNAEVVAEPLPEGVSYREAIVRFEIPGNYLDYKFMQGKKEDFDRADVNRDGEVTVADVDVVINMIMNGNQDPIGDVNADGEVTVADVDAIINRILSK